MVSAAPLLLFLAVPWGRGAVYQEFLWVFVRTVGSPFWITIWLLLAFYGWAWVRRVQGAGRDGLVAALLLSIVDSWTIDPHTSDRAAYLAACGDCGRRHSCRAFGCVP